MYPNANVPKYPIVAPPGPAKIVPIVAPVLAAPEAPAAADLAAQLVQKPSPTYHLHLFNTQFFHNCGVNKVKKLIKNTQT